MKCIQCGAESMRRHRKDGRCSICKHRFAFEPTKDANRVTDGQFMAAIDRVSGDGRLHFTERALWYEFNRKWMQPGFWRRPYGRLPLAGAALGAFAGGWIGAPYNAVPFALGVGLAGLAAGTLAGLVMSLWANATSPRPPRQPRILYPEFRRAYLGRWRAVHGDVPGLLSPRELARPAAPREVPGDVAAFSFDRAVVTDRWETAAMLVANRFHFEHNCAVLSLDGFPGDIAGTVMAMLRRNPNLTVFALHDASSAGCMLPLRLRDPAWFPDTSVRIVDVGLRPAHVRQLGLPALHHSSSPAGTGLVLAPALQVMEARAPEREDPRLGQVLPPEDMAWLSRRQVGELAALRPAQVMRALHQGIAAVAAADAGGTSLVAGGSGGSGGGG
ncbi:MAG TPA: hypothetical protein VK358_03325, partial [Longimicrobium sp.]|nr:hypothetical protein [Longimicrobium sp.]